MGVYKRGNNWWYEFTYAGRRVRESANTTRKTLAVEAEKRRRLEMERASVGLPSESPNDRVRGVSAVLKAFAEAYGVNHRGKSLLVVQNRSAHLERLMGGLLLSEVTANRALDYMRHRREEGASNRTINMELQVLSRAMGHTWKALWPKLKKLEENHDVGKALEPEQEVAILEAARRNSSRLIYPFLMTLCWTGIRSDESRTLRWAQVDFEAGELIVGRSKTEAGKGRRIPMSGALRAALEAHAAWYAGHFGPILPEWCVFPMSRTKKPADPERPVTSLKTAWDTVRREAGVHCRLHDFRHSFCTKLAEAGVPESTMLDMMGHVSTTMLRRYSHIRAQARRDAIDMLESRQNSVGVPTKVPTLNESTNAAKTITH